MANEHDPPTSDLEIRLQVIAELRGAFREAVSLCDLVSLRLARAKSVAEQDRIGDELERFIRALSLRALALGSPSLADLSTVGRDPSSMKGETK